MTTRTIVGVAAAACLTTTAFGKVEWNRKIEAVAVLPELAGGIGTQGGMTKGDAGAIVVIFSIELNGPAKQLNELIEEQLIDLRTDVFIEINGSLLSVQTAQIPPGPNEFGNSATISGMYVMQAVPVVGLTEFDVINASVHAAEGALPDNDLRGASDNAMTMEYLGDPITWDRHFGEARIQPLLTDLGSRVDIAVDLDLLLNYDGPLDVGTQFVLLVNGEQHDSLTSAGPGIDLHHDGRATLFVQCARGQSGCALNAVGNPVGECLAAHAVAADPADSGCLVPGHQSVTFNGVAASAGDEITVILRPSAGAIPELQGISTGDVLTMTVPDFTCPADVNHDGVIDELDVIAMTGADCFGATDDDCGFDVDGDGQVTERDLMEVISSFGPCNGDDSAESNVGKPIRLEIERNTRIPVGVNDFSSDL